jgi:hypothetical protein
MILAAQEPTEILLQHVNARLHKSLKSLEAITKFGVAPATYVPDLAPSHFHLLGALKDVIHSVKPENDDDVIHTVKTWLCE